jgi:hypothetical protein
MSGHANIITILPITINSWSSTDDISGQTCTITVKADGTIVTSNSDGVFQTLNWFNPTTSGGGAGYFVKITRTGGTAAAFTSNQANTFASLATDKTAYMQRLPTGTQNLTFSVEIASDAAGTTIVTSDMSTQMTCTVLAP